MFGWASNTQREENMTKTPPKKSYKSTGWAARRRPKKWHPKPAPTPLPGLDHTQYNIFSIAARYKPKPVCAPLIPDPYFPEHSTDTVIPQSAPVGYAPPSTGTGMLSTSFDPQIAIDWHMRFFGCPPAWATFTVSTAKNPDGRFFKAAAAIGKVPKGGRPTRVIEVFEIETGQLRCQLRSVYPEKIIGDAHLLLSDRNTHLPLFPTA